MGQPCIVREIVDSRNLLTQSSARYSITDSSTPCLKRSTSAKIRAFSKSPSTNIYTVNPGVGRKSLGRVESLKVETVQHRMESQPLSKIFSRDAPIMSPVTKPVVRRRSCDIPLRSSVKRMSCSEEPVRVKRRSSSGWRINFNEPDGADVSSTLESRGVPDGAECTLRDQLVPRPRLNNSIDTLEQQYDDIKSVLKTMEEEFDKSNVQQMKEVFFPDSSSISAQNMSYSEMIQSAYERMKVETKELGISPSDNLSKRLGKELKIRNRRSGEHRVIRSPSERKIGTIRRRSRDLVQNAAKSQTNVDDTLESKPVQTPKMKGTLMQTPINTTLKRGRPNSVKSGLPFVVRSTSKGISDSPVGFAETPTTGINRKVIINKRNDDSALRSTCNEEGKAICKIYNNESSGEQLSINMNMSSMSVDDSLTGSFLEHLSVPLTRRRSHRLSLVSSVPVLKFSSTETSINEGYQRDYSNCLLNLQHNISDINMEVDEQIAQKDKLVNKKNQCAVYAESEAGEEQWMPATEFISCAEDHENLRGEGNIGRPSLAALIKQKKVTANVQLFNNLNAPSPYQRRQSRLRCTPNQPPEHSSASDQRVTRLSYSRSMSHRSTMTPRELLKARQKSLQFDRAPHSVTKIAIVSPLKESNRINIQQEHSRDTPKAYKGEATVPKTLIRKEEDMRFKTPDSLMSPVHKKSTFGVSHLVPTEDSVSPPKLPPRSSVKPSPIRIQYR